MFTQFNITEFPVAAEVTYLDGRLCIFSLCLSCLMLCCRDGYQTLLFFGTDGDVTAAQITESWHGVI